jgi:hypothetical protein
MMRKVLIFALALTAPAVGSLPARAQGAAYAQPAKVRLEGLIRRRFPEFYGRTFHGEALIVEEFFPVGWSKDGKFAYYTEPPDEACGCYFGQLFILDLVNDKVLWSFDYNGLDHQGEDEKNLPKSINDLWRANRKLFSDKLKEYDIVPQGRFSLLNFPASYNGDQLRADLKIVENKNAETSPYGVVKQATLQLTSRRQGKKTVFENTYVTGREEYEASPLALKVLGYLKSPFEPRVAVVMIEVWRGYEGPPHTTRIKIVGASLTGGFK